MTVVTTEINDNPKQISDKQNESKLFFGECKKLLTLVFFFVIITVAADGAGHFGEISKWS